MAKKPVDPSSPNFRKSAQGFASPIDPSEMASYSFMDRVRATMNVWMGPGLPPQTSAPESEPPRIFDYIPGLNSWQNVDSLKKQDSGGVTFEYLRALAGQTIINGAINKAAEKAKKIEFTWTVLPKEGETPQQTQKRSDTDPRVTELRTFFEMPDKDRDWPEWIQDAWIQTLTCDNLSVLRTDFAYGKDRPPFALDIIDGDNIQPVIDESGRVPIDPDATAYIQWTRGLPRQKLTRKQLLYRMCWPSAQKVMGNSPVERMWFYLNVALRRDMTKLSWYTEGNIPAGIWPVSTKDWGAAEIAKAQDLLDLVTSGKGSKSKLLLVPAGDGNPVFPAEKSLLDPFDDYLVRVACWFIGVPNTALIQQVNRSTAETGRDNADEEGELPRTDFTRRLLNRLAKQWWGYDDLRALPKRDQELDAAKQSEIDDRGIRNGSKQIDEVRKNNGDEPLGLKPGYMTAKGYFEFEATPSADDEGDDRGAQADAVIDESSKRDGQFKFASVQVNITGPVAKSILEMAAAIPDDALAEKGREDQPHVTAKFGVKPEVSIADLRAAVGSVSGSMTFGTTAFFPADGYDVVFVTVNSQDLRDLNASIADGVSSVETQDNYVPHATIAHVESGRGHEFAGIGTLVGVEYAYTAIHFSDTDGNLTKLQAVKGHVRAKQVAA